MAPLTRFLRRRRTEIGVSCGILVLLVLFAGLALPERHVAVALVTPNLPGYRQPVGRYIAEVDSAGLLGRLADPDGVGWVARLWGVPAAAEERLRAPGWAHVAQVRNDSSQNVEIEVRVQGLNRVEALRVAQGVAAEIVRLDQEAARTGQVAPLASATPASGPSSAQIEGQLRGLRARFPELGEAAPAPGAQLAGEEADYARRREAEQGLEGRLAQEAAHADALRLRVEAEARALWASHLEELATRARDEARRSAPPARIEPRPRPAALEPDELAALEAQLRELLATRTLRHPEVRGLLRRIELERTRLARAAGWEGAPVEIPADAPGALSPDELGPSAPGGGSGSSPGGSARPRDPAPPSGADEAPGPPAPSAPATEEAAGPGLSWPISEDARPSGESLQPSEAAPPPEWLQRAPSYREWIAATDRLARTRAELEAEVARSAAMRARLDRAAEEAGRRAAEVEAARREEARLLALLRARPAPLEAEASGPVARPVLCSTEARALSAWRPSDYLFQGLGAALALSLLLAWSIDQRDPAIHELEDVTRLGVPVLGVIPHLR